MYHVVKKYLVPNHTNEYRPHIFRTRAILSTGLLALLVFFFSLSYTAILSRHNFLAAVLPSVLVDLANQDRELYNLTPLTRNAVLEAAAQEKANDMAQYSYFAHNSPAGITPWYWFVKAGYRFIYAGENLAVNFSDSTEVNTAWMNSPGHRANILNGSFTDIGIATVQGIYEGRPTVFVVQLFGRPAAQIPVVAGVNVNTDANVVSASEKPPVTVTPPKVEAIVDTPTYVAVVNKDIPEAERDTTPIVATNSTDDSTSYATLPQKLLSSPSTVMSLIYTILAALILLAIIISLAIEFKRHHAKHVISGVALLAFIFLLFALYQNLASTPLVIV